MDTTTPISTIARGFSAVKNAAIITLTWMGHNITLILKTVWTSIGTGLEWAWPRVGVAIETLWAIFLPNFIRLGQFIYTSSGVILGMFIATIVFSRSALKDTPQESLEKSYLYLGLSIISAVTAAVLLTQLEYVPRFV